MDRTDPNSGRNLENSILREQFRKASVAAHEVHDVVERSIRNNYREMKPRYYMDAPWHGLLFAGAGMCIAFAPFALIPAASAAFQAGVPSIAIAVAGLAVWAGPAFYFVHISEKKKTPRQQLAVASKRLSSATKRLPDGPERRLLQDFLFGAKRIFALGKVALIQQRILSGHEHPRKVRKLYNEGESLLGRAAHDSLFKAEECEKLRAAFNAGTLSSPKAYSELLDERYRNVQEELSKATGDSPLPPESSRSVKLIISC